ncbi:PREDICTED: membrane primary amine oxidase-like isoform X2 [Nanorana parkeri]|uniref:membrane primary amine oxidase-like isoform X2 n=1 Tax=Nanorana parkeri TaxID=125878 RepID=UPI0008548FBF|nr:PREDICTED: membrane primary amine oxidase-like isoform X2 [Nanorana parkeri]
MNVKVVTTVLILAILTILALVLVILFDPKPKSCSLENEKALLLKHNDKSLVFADLTPEELIEVLSYLKKTLQENLVDISAAEPGSNCIYSVELLPPKKQDALLYLDKGGPKPRREALAIVYFGSHAEPVIKEYVVGPLPKPTSINDITAKKYKDKLPYYRRPVIGSEYMQIRRYMLLKEFPKAKSFLKEVFGHNESDHEFFSALTSAPRGLKSGDRNTWFGIFYNTQGSGYFLHPVGLELLVNHKHLDVTKWRVDKVFYNGQYFDTLSDLEEKYKSGNLKTVKMQKPHLKDDIGSMKPQKLSIADIPMQYEPQSARYSVRNNQVLFQHWSFAFGVNVNTGLRLYDIKFRGERIVYELGAQEAISIYGSNAPTGMSTRYMDGHFGIGRSTYQLVRGIDCPYFATYVDTHYLLDSDTAVLNKGSICIFELNSGIPLRRHFSSLGSSYYGGLVNTVLVIRTIATLGNYDYVFDYVFYQNGAIESKVHATGYISTSFFMENGVEHGHRVGPHTLGTIHTHFINYKVDLDVGGLNNSVVALDMEFQDMNIPWNPELKLQQTRLTRKVLETEDQSAFQLHGPMPRYIQFASKQKNKWDHQRGYKLAVTKYKDNEQHSSSIYNQNDPWSPSVKFSSFIDNENIQEQDLVAWITTGFLHIPHSEDIPNTVTAGNGVGFFLRPYNYFDEDPSVHSEDAVYFMPHEDLSSCSVNPLACIPEKASCVPKPPPFTYNGFDNTYIVL